MYRKTITATRRTKLYQCWRDIHKRMSPGHKDYKYYAGRGIRCKFDSFDSFRSYVMSLPNLRRGAVLDRKNNDGHYEPGNLRWVTWAESNRNRVFR